VHPLVTADRADFLADARAKKLWLAGVDVPLLFETMEIPKDHGVDHVLAVSCEAAEQRRRALARPRMTPEKLDSILARQLPDAERTAKADSVVDTNFFDRARATAQTAAVVERLWPAAVPDASKAPRAVTLDLDNTLWPTLPPLLKIQEAMPGLVRFHLPNAAAALGDTDVSIEKGLKDWEAARPKLDLEPDIRHDITARRRLFFRQLAASRGDDETAADALVADFVQRRAAATDAFLDEAAPRAVTALKDAGLKVGAVTNGNARRAGRLGELLDFWLAAADTGAMKPRSPQFIAACAAAGCAPAELVHVGDSLAEDVLGALDFGARAIHVTKYASDKTKDADPALAARLAAHAGRYAVVDDVAAVPGIVAGWA